MAFTPVSPGGGTSGVYVAGDSLQQVTIKGSGDVATDMAAMFAARDYFETVNGGVLQVDGKVKLNAIVNWNTNNATMRVDMIGISSDAELDVVDPAVRIAWGSYWDPRISATPVAFSGIAAGGAFFQSPNLTLAVGDTFVIWDDSYVIPDGPAHLTDQRPMEIHQVKEIRGSDIYFDDFVVDPMLTTPLIAKVPIIEGARIENLKFSYSGTNENTRFLDIRNVNGLVIRDCTVMAAGPGPVLISNCINTDIDNFNCISKENFENDFGYHIIASLVNNFNFHDSFASGTRHVFTTSSGSASGGTRWGTPRNVKVVNVTTRQNGKSTSSLPAFDTHAEGWGVEFIGCTAVVPDDSVNGGFQTRSRNTVFRNCLVVGGGAEGASIAIGFRLYGSSPKMIDCIVENCWQAVRVQSVDSIYTPANVYIEGFRCYSIGGMAIRVYEATGVNIIGCNLDDCCRRVTSNSEASIQIDDATGVKIQSCEMNKRNLKEFSVHTGNVIGSEIEIVGCNVLGYGAGILGIDDGTSAGPGIEAEWAPYNVTDI